MWCDWSEPYNDVYTEIQQELDLAAQLNANTIRTFVQFSAVEAKVGRDVRWLFSFSKTSSDLMIFRTLYQELLLGIWRGYP